MVNPTAAQRDTPETCMTYEDPTREFMRLANGLQAGLIDFDANTGDSGGEDGLNVEKLIKETPIQDANSVSSRRINAIGQKTGKHMVVLDIDMEAALVPSSTPGHYHLFIDTQLDWETYKNVLRALVDAEIIQRGYYNAAMERKATWVRTPWTRKT